MKKVLASLAIVGLLLSSFALPTDKDLNSKTANLSIVNERANLPNTVAVATLKKYYKADDGSYIYVRQIKDKVYAFAEHLNGSAASVIVGYIKGDMILGSYYYMPKGEARGTGTLSFRIESGGSQLTLKTDTSTIYNIKSMTSMTLPARVPAIRRAWYRGNTPSNLTGRWMAQNVGESHVLEIDDQIIMYSSGHRKGNNLRPQFSSVFIGKRTGNNIRGKYVDLPLGHTKSSGEAGFSVEGTHKLVVNHNYYPGVKHERVLADTREIMNKTVNRDSRTKALKSSAVKGANHQ